MQLKAKLKQEKTNPSTTLTVAVTFFKRRKKSGEKDESKKSANQSVWFFYFLTWFCFEHMRFRQAPFPLCYVGVANNTGLQINTFKKKNFFAFFTWLRLKIYKVNNNGHILDTLRRNEGEIQVIMKSSTFEAEGC